MSDVEHEQTEDDFAVDITDIDKSGDNASDSRMPLPAKLPGISLEPRLALHQRRRQLIITGGVVVLAVLLILGSSASVRDLVSGIFIRPTPTPLPTIAPGSDLFYVQGNPAWGHLFIDGHVVAQLPRISIDRPLRFSRGRHVLLWRADPFLSLSCTVSVPARYATDTCSYNESVQLDAGLSAWVITFSVSLASLPAEQHAALVQAVQAALDAQQSSATVQPGELYALALNDPECRGERLCYATARQPLKATLSFQLDANEASDATCVDPEPSCTFSYQNCHLFCPGFESSSPAVAEWDVLAPVRSLWKFATLDGRVLARDIPDSPGDYATGQVIESLVPLGITWDSLGWHVSVSYDASAQNSGFFDPVCAAAQDEVQSFEPPGVVGEPVYLQWQFVPGPVPAAGCVALGAPKENAFTTATSTISHSKLAYCLHRFGVNLAANEVAQRYWPYLPVADAGEQRLAQQLAGLVKEPSS
jgi:hypothetical protein